MKFYDYIFCIWVADIIAGGVVMQNLFLFSIGVGLYLLYEKMRSEDNISL